MKVKKLIIAAVLCVSFPIFAESASFQSENYSINVKYNNEVSPGMRFL